jgi:GWxTD domain-containing protein
MINRFGCLLFFISFLFAQESVVREQTSGDVSFFEAHAILGGNDTGFVHAVFRVRHDFFVFTVTPGDPGFVASGEATVEVLDSNGLSIARQITAITIRSKSNSMQILRMNYHQHAMAFALPQGTYTLLLRIEDSESKQQSPDIRRTVTMPNRQQAIRSSLIPVESPTSEKNKYLLPNLGGDLFFSRDFLFLAVHAHSLFDSARYVIRATGDEGTGKPTIVVDTIVRVFSYPGIPEVLNDSSSIIIDFTPVDGKTTYAIPLRVSKIRQSRYEVTVTFPDSSSSTTSFGTRWLDMPRSLTDLEIATLPLQYLLQEKEYGELRRGSRTTRIKKFEAFWSSKDPTPETAFNEMMAEFYRRVDHTISAYRTLKEPNGSLTDRGKIFILYGRPTTTDRQLRPGTVPKEIWTYDNLKKTFIFEDPRRQGEYSLVGSQ